MNNDLISRSELKSVLKNECFWCANRDEPCDKPCWHCINEKIDNAPTVEQPQGEWDKRHTELLKYFVKCEKCGEEIMTSHKNFCPNCGTRVKGGAE